MDQENRLGFAKGDYFALAAKGLSGLIPYIGPVIGEVLGAVIPNQKTDRLQRLLVEIEKRVAKLELDCEVLRARFMKPEYLDLFEDGATQAARAFSGERVKYIAHILVDGLKDSELSHLKAKKLLQLLSQVSDPEIIYLTFYYLVRAGQPGEDTEFWKRHQGLLEPKDNSYGLPIENHEEFEIQETYIDNLERLRLVQKGTSGPPSVTNLGSLFLRSIMGAKGIGKSSD